MVETECGVGKLALGYRFGYHATTTCRTTIRLKSSEAGSSASSTGALHMAHASLQRSHVWAEGTNVAGPRDVRPHHPAA